ncbi:MAG: hypothetical protein AB1298_05055 [Bacteroidota bacterium]
MNLFRPYPKVFFVLVILIIVTLTQSCDIKEPTAPNWDVSLNVPIANKNYSLLDIIENKSSLIKHYTDGANKNLLYYTHVKEIDKIVLNDKLKIDPFSKSATETIGSINIGSDSVRSDIDFSWIGSGIQPGTQTQIPQINDVPVSINFTSAAEFQSIKIESGTLDFKITNYFPSPVSITIKNFVLKNSTTGETIAQYSAPISIPPLQTAGVQSIPITQGVLVKNQLSLDCSISTNGSNGQTITIPAKSLTIYAKLRDLKVSEAVAKIPQQDPVIIDGVVTIDETSAQPSKFQNIKLDGGLLNLTITNNLDIDAIATFTINNLKNPLGETFSETRAIPRKQTIKLYNNFSIKDYSIVSLNGVPTNQVSYSVSFQLYTSPDYRNINSSDAVTGTIDFNSLSVKEFTGLLKPTVLEKTRSAVSLDVKDIQNKLQFQQINLKNPKIELRLRPTANLEFSVDGKIEAKNSIGQKSVMTLSPRTMNITTITPTDTIITLNADSLSNFFKKFSSFPDSLIISTGGTVNPNYKLVNVKNTDQVTGKGRMEFPFEFGLSGGEFSDSVAVDLSKDDRDRIRDLNSIEASLKISNGIPASVGFTGKLYDQNKNFLMYFPPKYQDQDTVVSVNGAATDENGNVISKTEQTIRVRTIQGESDKIARAAFMRVRVKFNTSRAGNLPVKFKTDDVIKIIASGSTNYRVKP